MIRTILSLVFLFLTSFSQSESSHSPKNFEIKIDEEISGAVFELVVNNSDNIKTEYQKISAFKNYPFQPASLFILSDVLLNRRQIENIRKSSAKLFEDCETTTVDYVDSLNLFQNHVMKIGKYTFVIYGNQTNNINFISIQNDELESIFEIDSINNLIETKELLLDQLIRYSNEEDYKLPGKYIAGFNQLGLMQREIMSIPVLSTEESDTLFNISSIITEDLVKILNDARDEILKSYSNSTLKKRLSFNEYFCLWNQVLIRDITNKLIETGYVTIPASRNFNYILKIVN